MCVGTCVCLIVNWSVCVCVLTAHGCLSQTILSIYVSKKTIFLIRVSKTTILLTCFQNLNLHNDVYLFTHLYYWLIYTVYLVSLLNNDWKVS